MKNTNKETLSFEEYKKTIDELIDLKKIDKLKLHPDYFNICNNYWIIDKYIASDGVCDESLTPNTFSAYKQCIENDYAISIPVQMLDDDSLICFSHRNISRVVPTESGYISTMSLEQVKEINLNDKKEKIPTLDEALEFIAGKTPVIIEIINDGTVDKIENKVICTICKYMQKYNCFQDIAISSINPYTLEFFFNNFPYITRILKSGDFKEKVYGSFKTKKLKKLKYYKITHADFIAYSHDMLSSRAIKKYKPVGVIAHTILNQNQYISVAERCDNIIFKNFKPTI
jgi:glycerophosphoryl diester phosphodiesterase